MRIRERFGWAPIMEGEYIIGLEQDGQSVTLEPGGQFELSGATVDTLHKTCAEVNSHLYQVRGGSCGGASSSWGGSTGERQQPAGADRLCPQPNNSLRLLQRAMQPPHIAAPSATSHSLDTLPLHS